LDYYWIERDLEKMNVSDVEKQKIKEEKKKKQRDFFVSQLNLAKKLNLPLVIHNREAKNDIFGILKQENFKNFVFHCYTEDLEFANRLLDFAPNCKISFS
jgi:Tat protein secretion system quality control protein TatD with DNase activity